MRPPSSICWPGGRPRFFDVASLADRARRAHRRRRTLLHEPRQAARRYRLPIANSACAGSRSIPMTNSTRSCRRPAAGDLAVLADRLSQHPQPHPSGREVWRQRRGRARASIAGAAVRHPPWHHLPCGFASRRPRGVRRRSVDQVGQLIVSSGRPGRVIDIGGGFRPLSAFRPAGTRLLYGRDRARRTRSRSSIRASFCANRDARWWPSPRL